MVRVLDFQLFSSRGFTVSHATLCTVIFVDINVIGQHFQAPLLALPCASTKLAILVLQLLRTLRFLEGVQQIHFEFGVRGWVVAFVGFDALDVFEEI